MSAEACPYRWNLKEQGTTTLAPLRDQSIIGHSHSELLMLIGYRSHFLLQDSNYHRQYLHCALFPCSLFAMMRQ
jgi:hypothetical protein